MWSLGSHLTREGAGLRASKKAAKSLFPAYRILIAGADGASAVISY